MEFLSYTFMKALQFWVLENFHIKEGNIFLKFLAYQTSDK